MRFAAVVMGGLSVLSCSACASHLISMTATSHQVSVTQTTEPSSAVARPSPAASTKYGVAAGSTAAPSVSASPWSSTGPVEFSGPVVLKGPASLFAMEGAGWTVTAYAHLTSTRVPHDGAVVVAAVQLFASMNSGTVTKGVFVFKASDGKRYQPLRRSDPHLDGHHSLLLPPPRNARTSGDLVFAVPRGRGTLELLDNQGGVMASWNTMA